MLHRDRFLATALLAGVALVGGATLAAGKEGAPVSLSIRSERFTPGGEIPAQYTCEGKDTAPPLAFSGAPAGTKSLALIVDDPDAPDPKAPRVTWVHWVLANLPSEATGLPEGGKPLPVGVREGLNDWKKTGYGGPCPPIGRHRYFFKLYALDRVLDVTRPTKDELLRAMQGHILGQAELVGTYEKKLK